MWICHVTSSYKFQYQFSVTWVSNILGISYQTNQILLNWWWFLGYWTLFCNWHKGQNSMGFWELIFEHFVYSFIHSFHSFLFLFLTSYQWISATKMYHGKNISIWNFNYFDFFLLNGLFFCLTPKKNSINNS